MSAKNIFKKMDNAMTQYQGVGGDVAHGLDDQLQSHNPGIRMSLTQILLKERKSELEILQENSDDVRKNIEELEESTRNEAKIKFEELFATQRKEIQINQTMERSFGCASIVVTALIWLTVSNFAKSCASTTLTYFYRYLYWLMYWTRLLDDNNPHQLCYKRGKGIQSVYSGVMVGYPKTNSWLSWFSGKTQLESHEEYKCSLPADQGGYDCEYASYCEQWVIIDESWTYWLAERFALAFVLVVVYWIFSSIVACFITKTSRYGSNEKLLFYEMAPPLCILFLMQRSKQFTEVLLADRTRRVVVPGDGGKNCILNDDAYINDYETKHAEGPKSRLEEEQTSINEQITTLNAEILALENRIIEEEQSEIRARAEHKRDMEKLAYQSEQHKIQANSEHQRKIELSKVGFSYAVIQFVQTCTTFFMFFSQQLWLLDTTS